MCSPRKTHPPTWGMVASKKQSKGKSPVDGPSDQGSWNDLTCDVAVDDVDVDSMGIRRKVDLVMFLGEV